MLGGTREIAANGAAYVAVGAFFFLLDHDEPVVHCHALQATAAVFAYFGIERAGPGVFVGNAVREVDAAVDELGRRPHFLAFADHVVIAGDLFGDGDAVLDGHFDPLFEAHDFALASGVELALEEELRLGFGRLGWFFGEFGSGQLAEDIIQDADRVGGTRPCRCCFVRAAVAFALF